MKDAANVNSVDGLLRNPADPESASLDPATLDSASRQRLIVFLKTMADDELVLGQRSSEWLGMAPDLEEDIAFSSICQDELGHSMFFFGLLETLGEGNIDDLAFRRPVEQRLNSRLVELENHDFAFTVTRNYLYELFDGIRLTAALKSSYKPLADGVRKIVREEYYHLLHLHSIMSKLAAAGGEATAKVNAALAVLWPQLADLCSIEDGDGTLRGAGVLTQLESELYSQFGRVVRERFEELQLPWRPLPELRSRSRNTGGNEVLGHLLAEMNEVCGTVPATEW